MSIITLIFYICIFCLLGIPMRRLAAVFFALAKVLKTLEWSDFRPTYKDEATIEAGGLAIWPVIFIAASFKLAVWAVYRFFCLLALLIIRPFKK